MRSINGIEKCWTIDGKIKYKAQDDTRIYMIKNEWDFNQMRASFGVIDYEPVPEVSRSYKVVH